MNTHRFLLRAILAVLCASATGARGAATLAFGGAEFQCSNQFDSSQCVMATRGGYPAGAFIWNAGDYWRQTFRSTGIPSANTIALNLVLGTTLTGGAGESFEVLVNGIRVGTFVASPQDSPGSTALKQQFSFPSVAGPDYTVTIRVVASMNANSGAVGLVTANSLSTIVIADPVPDATPVFTNTKPVVESVSPTSGRGDQIFSAVYRDGNGWADITHARLMVSKANSPQNACYADYNRATNSFSLMNDTGTAWLAPAIAGRATVLRNSSCSLTVAQSSAVGTGNSLVVTFALSFSQGFGGKQTIFLEATDTAGTSSGAVPMGDWFPASPGHAAVLPGALPPLRSSRSEPVLQRVSLAPCHGHGIPAATRRLTTGLPENIKPTLSIRASAWLSGSVTHYV